MDPDFIFIVPYECPRCHASLEARASGPPSWLRCPSCGRASLPPEIIRSPPPPIDDQAFLIGAFSNVPADLPIRPRAMAPRPSPASTKVPTARLLLGTGFFFTVFLFLFSLLEPDMGRSALFGVAAAVFLFLLARPSAPARDD